MNREKKKIKIKNIFYVLYVVVVGICICNNDMHAPALTPANYILYTAGVANATAVAVPPHTGTPSLPQSSPINRKTI